MSEYPEHEKLAIVKDLSQEIGEFLEWAETEGIMLCERSQPEDYYDSLVPIREPRTHMLARFFKIDPDKLEEEKIHMLEEQRDLNARLATEKLADQYGDTISELKDQ